MNRIMIVAYCLLLRPTFVTAQPGNTEGVEKVFNRKGTVQSGVLKFGFPRSDLRIMVDNVRIDPSLALTSWIAFLQGGDHSMMMGDLVLLEPEIGPVMNRLVGAGIGVSALHNHIINETPKVMYMHFAGHGNPVALAETMNVVLSLTGTPLVPSTTGATPVTPDWSGIESVLGATGQRKGKVLQVGFPRSETITENGMTIPAFMGMATALNFQQDGNSVAATGDFVLLGSEVNDVVKALTDNGIAVTALHNHMIDESPRLFFLHFWASGEPLKVARGLRVALDRTNLAKK